MPTPNNNSGAIPAISANVIHGKIYANPSVKENSGAITPGTINDTIFHVNQEAYSDHAIRRMNEAGVQEYGLDKIYSKLSTDTRQILDAINQGWSAGSRTSSVGEEVAFNDGQKEYHVLDKDGFMPEDGHILLLFLPSILNFL